MQIEGTVKNQVIDVCKRFGVKELHLFGSALTGDYKDSNDIDLLVVFDRRGFEGAFDQFMGLKDSLEEIFGKPVDLVTARKFRNPIFNKEVESTKELIYAA